MSSKHLILNINKLFVGKTILSTNRNIVHLRRYDLFKKGVEPSVFPNDVIFYNVDRVYTPIVDERVFSNFKKLFPHTSSVVYVDMKNPPRINGLKRETISLEEYIDILDNIKSFDVL
jgi:hypothetical protein